MVDWKNVMPLFDRFPKLSEQLKEIGDKANVVFMDDGKFVKSEVLANALKEKGKKNIKARDSEVFHVKSKGVSYELWLSATAFSNLRELKGIADENKGTLINALVTVERVSKGDMSTQAFKFSAT